MLVGLLLCEWKCCVATVRSALICLMVLCCGAAVQLNMNYIVQNVSCCMLIEVNITQQCCNFWSCVLSHVSSARQQLHIVKEELLERMPACCVTLFMTEALSIHDRSILILQARLSLLLGMEMWARGQLLP